MSDSGQTEQEVKTSPSLKEVLLQTTFTPGRTISDSIHTIEFGPFAQDGRELISATLSDPQQRECGA